MMTQMALTARLVLFSRAAPCNSDTVLDDTNTDFTPYKKNTVVLKISWNKDTVLT